jgi:hypothetical protein
MTLTVRLTRISPTHHRFEAIRADGSEERLELETRSYLLHDLSHFALELAARRQDGFFGLLALGGAYAPTAETWSGEAGRIEKVVAILQGAYKAGLNEADFRGRVHGAFEALDEHPPAWLTEQVALDAFETLRSFVGRWKATPFGDAMELVFPQRP